jgi:hypothetical protein
MEGSQKFYPHRSKLQINREEPTSITIDQVERIKMLHERATKKALFAAKTKTVSSGDAKKFRERVFALNEFLKCWNDWRHFYFEAPPVSIKTKSQLTTCENIVQKIKDQNYNMSLFVACVHKAYQKRKFRPEFTACLHQGDEYYEKLYDSVMGDIQLREYEDNA